MPLHNRPAITHRAATTSSRQRASALIEEDADEIETEMVRKLKFIVKNRGLGTLNTDVELTSKINSWLQLTYDVITQSIHTLRASSSMDPDIKKDVKAFLGAGRKITIKTSDFSDRLNLLLSNIYGNFKNNVGGRINLIEFYNKMKVRRLLRCRNVITIRKGFL